MWSDDGTRVKLPVADGAAAEDDYINANYIVVGKTFHKMYTYMPAYKNVRVWFIKWATKFLP